MVARVALADATAVAARAGFVVDRVDERSESRRGLEQRPPVVELALAKRGLLGPDLGPAREQRSLDAQRLRQRKEHAHGGPRPAGRSFPRLAALCHVAHDAPTVYRSGREKVKPGPTYSDRRTSLGYIAIAARRQVSEPSTAHRSSGL